MGAHLSPIRLQSLQAACSECSLRELCLPMGLGQEQLARLDALIGLRRAVARGEALFREGDHFDAFYAVRLGFFKTSVGSADGREQVTGFQMAGELLGLDGVGHGRHHCGAIALEDSQVCVIPFQAVEDLARTLPDLQHSLHRLMSREIVRDHSTLFALGSLRADERVAAFLLGLARRLEARGFSSRDLVLRPSREEMGSYLGLKLETVSRALSHLQNEGVLAVRLKQLQIIDIERLRAFAGGHAA